MTFVLQIIRTKVKYIQYVLLFHSVDSILHLKKITSEPSTVCPAFVPIQIFQSYVKIIILASSLEKTYVLGKWQVTENEFELS